MTINTWFHGLRDEGLQRGQVWKRDVEVVLMVRARQLEPRVIAISESRKARHSRLPDSASTRDSYTGH
jgi:hypothetical protein